MMYGCPADATSVSAAYKKVVMLMKQRVILLLFASFLVLLLPPVLTGCKKTVPGENAPASRIGVVDMEKAVRAHSRYSELQKLDQDIAKMQAETARISNTAAGNQGASVSGQSNAGYLQGLDQQFAEQMAHKRSELEQNLQSKAMAAKQEINQHLSEYAKELDKDYQPEILSLQLKMQTVQMTQDEREAVKKQINTLQEQRMQKLEQKQQQLEQELGPRMEQEKQQTEEQFRQYHAQLMAEANSRLSEQQKITESHRAEIADQYSGSVGQQKLSANLQVLQEQRDKLWQIIIRDIKDATARIAAQKNLEVVIVKYQQNVQAVDVTDAVMAEIKK